MIVFRRVRRANVVCFALSAMLLLTVVLVLACGGSSSPTTTSAGPSSLATSGSSSGRTVQVVMTNRQYDPKEVTVKVGDTVTWVNQDAPQHDVVADNGEFKSDLFDKGQSFSFAFAKAGTYPYHCSIHPGMTGTVIVQ